MTTIIDIKTKKELFAIEHLMKNSVNGVSYTHGFVDKEKFLKQVQDETDETFSLKNVKHGSITTEDGYAHFFEQELSKEQNVTYIEY